MKQFRKALAAVILGVPSWGVTAQDGGIDGGEWWGLVGVLATAALVWVVPNEPPDDALLDRLRGELPPDDDIATTGAP